ncbi:hypothetical protein SAMD00079811_33440 [Scytonema sp. HK-05]|uniref:SHOCT domain-containing protein n=1 Tax=Scytonema sp. HK-05 TaxID=1137095 RepID=UPI000936A50A|nr:SHOCT domain-containing protein [Scytonema sp. HK-05]OKH55650.1 hypothetical protein NIES2130_26490 [Scytonema sp. HK-05]BAY45737.1 hypothetical protein SAMD00079811_33440 [Scytonema sp. HK-05]
MDERFKTSQQQNLPSPTNLVNHKVIPGEIVLDSPVDSHDNRAKRRLELERLKQDLADGFLTEEEFEGERQKIFKKYPL